MVPMSVLRQIPAGEFKGDYIVGDNEGQIHLLTAECKRDASIDLFRNGPKVIDIRKHIRDLGVSYAVPGAWGDGLEMIHLNTVCIEECYLLRCGFSRELNVWFVSGEVRQH